MAFDSPDYFNRYAEREEHEGKKRILLFDNFEATRLTHGTSISGVGSVSRDFDTKHSGEASLKLVLGAVNGNKTGVYIRVGLPYTGVVVFDWWFAFAYSVQDVYLNLIVQLFTGTERIEGHVSYDSQNTRWRYWDSSGAYSVIPDSTQTFCLGALFFHHARLVLDFGRKKYVYLMSDNMLFDLSAYDMQVVSPDTTEEIIESLFQIENNGGATNGRLNLDDILVSEG